MNRRTGGAAVGVGLVTASLVAFWVSLEGNRETPYYDVAGVLTVCAGHTGSDVKLGEQWAKAQCDEVTIKDLTKFSFVVIQCVQAPLTRNQFESLVAFAGNVGEYAFCDSTLARLLNEDNFIGAEAQFQKWVYAGQQFVPGLMNRRMAELERFRAGNTMLAMRGAAIFQ